MSLSIFNITISSKFNLNITLHHLSFSILIICALDMEMIRILKCIIILILNPINFKILNLKQLNKFLNKFSFKLSINVKNYDIFCILEAKSKSLKLKLIN